ncbi:MAG: phenylacetate--CoA ligase family protein [Beijerinckiaceae bacterium]
MASSRFTRVIDAVPEPILALLTNCLGSYYRLIRHTGEMRRILAEWQKLEHLHPTEYQAYQLERLRHIAQVANTTPYYKKVFRKVGFDPANVRSLEDLKLLPFLTKDDLRKHGPEMIVPNSREPRLEKYSSGTTGQPVAFIQPRRMAFAQNFAILYQMYSWFGFSPLDRRATMAGRYMGIKPQGIVVRNLFENQLLLGVHALSERSVARYVRALDEFAPAMLHAHPSGLLMLKQLAEVTGQSAPKVSLISYTGENLSEEERSQLSEWLGGAIIFGTYGSGEMAIAAGECPELDGYHIHPATGICELEEVDGKKEVIGTSLLNDVMPLIRYRTGDLADRITFEKCLCGRHWPRLQGLQGRIDDLLFSANGAPIAPVVIRTGISSLGAITAPYSVIQHVTPATYTLQIYEEPSEVSQASIDTVVTFLRTILGEQSDIGVKCVSKKELFTSRAKHRIVIREKAGKV